jgi:hypothetical protein
MLEGILLAIGAFSAPIVLTLGFGVVAAVNRMHDEGDSREGGSEESSDDPFSMVTRAPILPRAGVAALG